MRLTFLPLLLVHLASCVEVNTSPELCSEAEDAAPDARSAPADATVDAKPSDADPFPNCGAVGEPCCTADPLHPCDNGLTCGVPPQDRCTPTFP